ncbi:MAG: VTT domain-containing protein [Hyphomicrobium sp.]|nr:VTT domain-containing protein [Hyphomicrobium sp.]
MTIDTIPVLAAVSDLAIPAAGVLRTTIDGFVNAVVGFVNTHRDWAVPIAFLVAFFESFCFVSILWPGTAIMAGITALLAASGAESSLVVPLILAATAGGTVGYALSYWIGHYFKETVPNIWPFRTRPQLIRHGEQFFERYGGWGVFLGHFIGPVRAVIPVVAGMFNMPHLRFQIANVTSASLWAAGVIAPSFYAVEYRAEIVAFVAEHRMAVLAVLFLLAAANSIPMPMIAVGSLVLFVLLGAAYLFADGSPGLALAAGTLGALAGDVAGYWTGHRHEKDLHEIWPNSFSPEAADQAEAMIEKQGIMCLIRSKFHTTLRSFIPLAAGAKGVAVAPFAGGAALSSLIWSAVLLAPMPLARALFNF